MLVADSDAVARRRLVRALGAARGIDVVGEVSSGREAVRLHAELAPDVVLIDVTIRRWSACGATRRMLASAPATRVILLTEADEPRRLAMCVKAGARGVLSKDRGGIETAAIVLRLLSLRPPTGGC